ncbi:GspE/PulE family protein [Pleionea sediminis]|uniref:GspE/PulE family protein n=1 Tax=Pleionea sediminis TaxID=2569479 RepID=UPI001186F666|nr:GspE/PulE family protein [Pleionea sediminis]
MTAFSSLVPFKQLNDSDVVCCLMDNSIEESHLLGINYVDQAINLQSHPIPFNALKYMIVNEAVIENYEEYVRSLNNGKEEPNLNHFRFKFSDGSVKEGLAVHCELDRNLWHILRYHQGHVYYVVIPSIHVSNHEIWPAKTTKLFNSSTSQWIDNAKNLDQIKIDEHLIEQFPSEILNQLNALPLFERDGAVYVALPEKPREDALQVLSFVAGKTIEPVSFNAKKIRAKLENYIQSQNELDALSELEEKGALKNELTVNDIERLGQQKGVKRLLHQIIFDAIEQGASDIHCHPRKQCFEIMFRVDGELRSVRKLNQSLKYALVSRIKILGGMNIAEHRLPQDGRIEISHHGKNVDLRISVMPTVFGESVVIRLLDSSKSVLNIQELGFDSADQQKLVHLLHASFGIFLVTGPTGSGKSTTLYAAIKSLIDEGPHIITIEEPVEYQIDGVTQIPVNHKVGYTFARALRNILRHDPDVIMLGEIRDEETAKIAIESALTGHLVLSTLHTNTAAATVTRLLEIGIEPYLLKDALIGVLSQRLVKKICKHCKHEAEVPGAIRTAIGADEHTQFFEGAGCKQCRGTGVSGRIAVYELLVMSEQLKESVENQESTTVLEKLAIGEGMIPLSSQAFNLAKEGIISAKEAYRVRANSS